MLHTECATKGWEHTDDKFKWLEHHEETWDVCLGIGSRGGSA